VAPVSHDVGTSSTLGYDAHPHRLPRTIWDEVVDLDLTDPEYWRVDGDPPYLENPWMSAECLASTRAALKAGQPMCIMCIYRPALVGTKAGVAICGQCAKACWESIVKRAQ
jgi:hypothetical protein